MIEQKFQEKVNTPSDINEHMNILFKYGSECSHITEMGVRGIVSTWAWLYAKPKKLIAYDLKNPSNWGGSLDEVEQYSNQLGINFNFYEADVLKIDIEDTDLLFIDTWHTYDQCKQELKLHAQKVNKYIIFHDTTTYEYSDESSGSVNSLDGVSSGKGLWPAIEEFLSENKEWTILERYYNNNGLTILKRNS
jgi:hypothetical protein